MGYAVAKKIKVEIELPEGKNIDEVLRGIKYRILEDRVERLRQLWERIDKKNAKVDRIPTREEIYADRTRY